MVGHDQHVFVGRIILGGPDDELYQGVCVPHADLAQVHELLRTHALQIVVAGNVIAAGAGPIAVAGIAAAIAVYLGHNVDLFGRADALGFVEVNVNVLLQNFVVGILVKHDRPRLVGRVAGGRGCRQRRQGRCRQGLDGNWLGDADNRFAGAGFGNRYVRFRKTRIGDSHVRFRQAIAIPAAQKLRAAKNSQQNQDDDDDE